MQRRHAQRGLVYSDKHRFHPVKESLLGDLDVSDVEVFDAVLDDAEVSVVELRLPLCVEVFREYRAVSDLVRMMVEMVGHNPGDKVFFEPRNWYMAVLGYNATCLTCRSYKILVPVAVGVEDQGGLGLDLWA